MEKTEKIKVEGISIGDWGIKYEVEGKYGSDMVSTLGTAIRYWLWHCGVPARIAFWGVKSDNSDDK